jgi:hypothetical protein
LVLVIHLLHHQAKVITAVLLIIHKQVVEVVALVGSVLMGKLEEMAVLAVLVLHPVSLVLS